jgi:hypothetical protein
LLAAILAVAWQTKNAKGGERLSPAGKLSLLLPSELPGVKITDVPLGPNELVDATAKDKMGYDDVVNREYVTSLGMFSVYIGYWAHGKRSPSHIAAHIPDRCWTLNGMSCLERKADYQLKTGGIDLEPTYWRRFTQDGTSEIETAFWHMVGREFYDYGGRLNDYTPPLRWAVNVAKDLFLVKEDQYFVRLLATRPLSDFRHDPAFMAVMERVARLGIRRH